MKIVYIIDDIIPPPLSIFFVDISNYQYLDLRDIRSSLL